MISDEELIYAIGGCLIIISMTAFTVFKARRDPEFVIRGNPFVEGGIKSKKLRLTILCIAVIVSVISVIGRLLGKI